MTTGIAIASTISAISSGIATGMTYNQTKEAKKQKKQQQHQANLTEIEERNKQQQLANTYKGMKTNLYSGDINGIDTENLLNQ